MAHVTLNVAFRTLSGRVGDAVFYTRYGRQHMRPYKKPSNPDTPAQRMRRSAFRNAVHAWQDLSEEEKSEWNTRARRLHINGYNAFISHTMSATPDALQACSHPIAADDSARRATYLRRPQCARGKSSPLQVRLVTAPYPRITRDNASYGPALARHNGRL